ncbi:hypothetical protein H7H78_17980 [Mycobacterium shinjukuense]|nr:hypothetical protein [Mycobacterium shinjukuense]MCV6987229.1 hypothetical protein [Mycobacterium shinjukuense]ORB64486.1 hypothetical protein BST45_16200 [Mycobacterium shinjukuense]
MASDRGADPSPARVTPGVDDHARQARPTVLCPQGHLNAWDYKFCERCGSPIGVVPWPSEESGAPQTTPGRSRVPLVVLAATLLVVAVVVTAVAYAVTRPSRNDREEPGSARGAATAGVPWGQAEAASCPDDPVLEAESVDLTSDGLAVSAAFMSACAGGDVESNSALEVTVADGRRDVAAGRFDFSADPLRIEPGIPARRTLVFPPGMYWRTPDMLSGAPALQVTRKGRSERWAAPVGSERTTIIAAEFAAPAYGSVNAVAEEVLSELRDSDFPYVRRDISNRWVPQVSSKRVGLVAAGKTWTSADILRDHLALRQRFGGARLVWSGHWTTFSGPDFWVTVVGPAQPTAGDANRWCDSNGFGGDDCFAKFISTFVGEQGTTVYRK